MECVGCADRSCYDLSRHSEASKTELTAQVTLPEPVRVVIVSVTLSACSIFFTSALLIAWKLSPINLPLEDSFVRTLQL